MKKVCFITIHVGPNFGSNLQTIATAEVIKRLGYEPLLINYCPKRVTSEYYWKSGNPNIKGILCRVAQAPVFYKNKRVYEGFLAAHCKMTDPIYDEDNFVVKCPKADIYLTGSDQVWNSIHNQGLNKRYYFDGIQGKKVAYASSFGLEELPSDEYKEVRKMLSEYSAVSVREDSAKGLVYSMGYEANHVLDPTFMLDKEEWTRYASNPIIKDPYLLMYTPYNIVDINKLYETARRISKAKNLKVITFSWNAKSEPLADQTIKWATPGDFLSLMYNADFVITNSFHGTAFSINLNKQFLVYMPSGFGTRIKSILLLAGLESRLMTGEESEIPYEELIDFSKTNEILDAERKKAMDFLNKALQ